MSEEDPTFFYEATEQRALAVATHALQLPRDVVSALNARKKYRSAIKHWEPFRVEAAVVIWAPHT